MAFEFAETTKRDIAGLGAVVPAHTLEKRQASDSWDKFRSVTRLLKVGGNVRINGRSVTIDNVEAAAGNRVHIRGFSDHGSIDGTFTPDELKAV